MPIFTGINNKAQNIEKIFVGINGKAKEVKAAYIGVNGKAKQVYTAAEPIIETMEFELGPGDFKLNVTGKNLSLVIDGEEQSIFSGELFTKTINDNGTATLSASIIKSISFTGNTALQVVKSAFPKCSKQITSFYNCFKNCSNLTTIPEGLFDNNTAVTDFAGCFEVCSNLTTIPEGLFDNNTAVTNFAGCFSFCFNLTTIPEGLFDNNTAVTTFGWCFNSCGSLTSSVPTLWDATKWPTVSYYVNCFYACTSAENYADIPDDWK